MGSVTKAHTLTAATEYVGFRRMGGCSEETGRNTHLPVSCLTLLSPCGFTGSRGRSVPLSESPPVCGSV